MKLTRGEDYPTDARKNAMDITSYFPFVFPYADKTSADDFDNMSGRDAMYPYGERASAYADAIKKDDLLISLSGEAVLPCAEMILSCVGIDLPSIHTVSPSADIMSLPADTISLPAEMLSAYGDKASPYAEIVSPYAEAMSAHDDVILPCADAILPYADVTLPLGVDTTTIISNPITIMVGTQFPNF